MSNIYLAYPQQLSAVVRTAPSGDNEYNLYSGARHAGFVSSSADTSFEFVYQFGAATAIDSIYIGNLKYPTGVFYPRSSQELTLFHSSDGTSWTQDHTFDLGRTGVDEKDFLVNFDTVTDVYFKIEITCDSGNLNLDKLFLCQYFDFETNLHDYSPFTVRKTESKMYSVDGNYLEGKSRARELVGLTLEFKGMTDTKLATLRAIVLSKKFSNVCLFTPPESTTAGIDLLDNYKVIYGKITSIKAEKIYYNYNLVTLEFQEED